MNTASPYGFSGRLNPNFPSQIIFDVTEQCNLACIHCSHPDYKNGPHYKGLNMDESIHAKVIREVATAGRGIVQYVRYTAMGEPLMHPKIFDFLSLAKRDSGTTVSLTSNGTLLTPRNAQHLLDSGVDIVDISLDAFSPEAYAKIRRQGNHAKTYGHVQHFLAERQRLNMPTKIVVTFIEQPDNAGEADDFKAFWESEGVDYVIIRRLHSDAGGKVEIKDYLAASLGASSRRPCLYPWERLTVSPGGYLNFCANCWTHEGEFAHVSTISIADAWKSEFMSELRAAHLSNNFSKCELCEKCPDWAQTRWPHEGRSFADMVEDLSA